VDYKAKWYQPLSSRFITLTKAAVGYGNSFNGDAKNFPFFKNFYAGGIDSVRGYAGNTLGPEDSKGKPTGGNFLVNGSFGLIFPNFVSDNLRTTAFVDAGNVYDTFNNQDYAGSKSGPIRYSVGIEADWLTPMGLIDISIAKPLNLRRGDSEEMFQFALGANFG
jgi:outer membrane protein insertion porin family